MAEFKTGTGFNQEGTGAQFEASAAARGEVGPVQGSVTGSAIAGVGASKDGVSSLFNF